MTRIQFQEMLDKINMFQTVEEMTLVDRYKHWLTGTGLQNTADQDKAHINFLLELKYNKNDKSIIFKQRHEIISEDDIRLMEERFFNYVFEQLMKMALKFDYEL